jgi:hypothetical protein
MAITSNKQVFAGTSFERYTDPLKQGKADGKGLYPWSTFRARLGTGTDTTFTALASVADNAVINLLLFTSDILAFGAVIDASSTTSVPVIGLPAPVLSVPFLDATSGGSDLSVPVGVVGQGYVGTVECSGFPAQVTIASAATSTLTDVFVLANGGVVNSPVSLLNWAAAATTSGALPVILSSANYTAVIRDAGNRIVTTGGIVYQVVGLYAVVV